MRFSLAGFVPFLLATPLAAAPMGPPAPVASRTTPAQEMIALYRDEYQHGFKPCPAPTHANEVVVCGTGRGGSADRLPLPDEREAPTGALALTTSCTSANCAGHGTLNPIAVAVTAVQIVRAIVDPEAASDYADRHPWKPDQ